MIWFVFLYGCGVSALVCIHRLRYLRKKEQLADSKFEGAHAEQIAVVDDGIADEEPAADQEGDSENSQRFDKNFFCRFPK